MKTTKKQYKNGIVRNKLAIPFDFFKLYLDQLNYYSLCGDLI